MKDWMKRRDFYRQEKGLLIPPPGNDKWHVSWTLDNVLSGFRYFFQQKGRWPMQQDVNNCPYLPSVRTIDRNFGGIVKIRGLLGMEVTEMNKGQVRSDMALRTWKRGFDLEKRVFGKLVERFFEPFVHNQSRVRVNEKLSVRVDFLVFHKNGKFAVDVYFPDSDRPHFASNTNMKFSLYKDFPFQLFLCVGNPQIGEGVIEQNAKAALKIRNKNVSVVSMDRFLRLEAMKFTPLMDPYSGKQVPIY